MSEIKTRAYAKINLSLDIVGKRADGYHNLATVMHTIPLWDDIAITIGAGNSIVAKTNLGYILSEKNIALHAAAAFFKRLHKRRAVVINIKKRIPVGAGLGGGSADAAAVLRRLNNHYDAPLSDQKLLELGATLGADVPFCLTGGCALCEGIGDIINPLPTLPPCHIVVVKPRISLSTTEMFRLYDGNKTKEHPDTQGLIKALGSGDMAGISQRVFNVMEHSAQTLSSEIRELHLALIRSGALCASMSGSGSAVYGIFDDPDSAKAAAAALGTGKNAAYTLEIV